MWYLFKFFYTYTEHALRVKVDIKVNVEPYDKKNLDQFLKTDYHPIF